MDHQPARPIVYGSPGQVEVLVESVARLLELEPDEVFGDGGVRRSGRQLAGLIERRLAVALMPNEAEEQA